MKVDIELVRQARQGDDDSFSQLYGQIAKDLYRFALYSLGNAHDAEDAVSEAVMEAYKGIGRLRDETKFQSWMMRILSIQCKHRIAGYVKEKNVVDIEKLVTQPSDSLDLLQSSTERVALAAALDTLSLQERQIVTLAVIEGYTTREIAQVFACPHGTVSSKLYRALLKLRKRLEE